MESKASNFLFGVLFVWDVIVPSALLFESIELLSYILLLFVEEFILLPVVFSLSFPQSVAFPEGLRTPGSPATATVPLHSVHSSAASTILPIFAEPSPSSLDPRAPYTRIPDKNTTMPAEETGRKLVQQPGSPMFQSFQGVGFGSVAGNCNPACPVVESGCGLDLDVEKSNKENRAALCKNDNDEDDFTTGVFVAEKEHQHCSRGAPLFTLTNSQLQVSEEFIDDDPAEISFFAGGSEAFSYVYSGLDLKGSDFSKRASESPGLTKDALQQNAVSPQSSPDRYSTEAVDMNMEDDFEFEEGSDFNGNERPSNTSELFEVKAQASRMQSLLSPSETSSLINNRSESSSLNNLPLNGTSSLHTYSSANHSEASSMVNFPAYSVRSESSSAFQFTDIIDQLEQLSYPPTTTEDSSSTDTDSWDSETAAPLDANLFFSNPFTQATGESFTCDFQNNLKNLTQEDWTEKTHVSHWFLILVVDSSQLFRLRSQKAVMSGTSNKKTRIHWLNFKSRITADHFSSCLSSVPLKHSNFSSTFCTTRCIQNMS